MQPGSAKLEWRRRLHGWDSIPVWLTQTACLKQASGVVNLSLLQGRAMPIWLRYCSRGNCLIDGPHLHYRNDVSMTPTTFLEVKTPRHTHATQHYYCTRLGQPLSPSVRMTTVTRSLVVIYWGRKYYFPSVAWIWGEKIAFSFLQQAGEHNSLPHIHATVGKSYFRPQYRGKAILKIKRTWGDKTTLFALSADGKMEMFHPTWKEPVSRALY